MIQINDKILCIWNTKRLEPSEANGHYPNESEVITISRIDDLFYYDDNLAVEVPIDQRFFKIKDHYYISEEDLNLCEGK
jgi:hypothetical protein